ncbi:MAG: hypothetical protein QOJ39_3118 [Candidatus Eremiobacteraeota bacterium]|jgi:hypothetical protein|nr:hypothetical protein [Candidatus Eremiobacteraeota bacterium]MEA2721254.1 hypothetical protein [Candidatus Eremiobacteraeota bacterium]
MTVFNVKPEFETALIQFGRVLRRASIFFMTNLADIIDPKCLSEGDEEYDYFLEVPADRLDDVSRRVAELQRTIREQFEIEIRVKPEAPAV